MKPGQYQATEAFAQQCDQADPLRALRDAFHVPKHPSGKDPLYFVGNSLGLQPKRTREYVDQELTAWAELGVDGHLAAKRAWYSYHELVTEPMARVVGAKPVEVVVMNSLTVNLHLMLHSFYRPTEKRFRVIIEKGAFPSDRYAVVSQIRSKGLDPAKVLIEWAPRPGEATLREADLIGLLEKEGPSVALVLLGNVQYLTGQAFDVPALTRAAHVAGACMGLDLAHGAGNLELRLHDWNVDFAVWCSYKYLNAGPGGIAGCFVHERHARAFDLPRMAGWWGHDKKLRFEMSPDFSVMPGAEGWQLSNPPILQLAALRASLEIFDEATMPALRRKSEQLTGFLEFLLNPLPQACRAILTPSNPAARGCHLSLQCPEGQQLVRWLADRGVLCDFRFPDVVRVAPAPLYTRFVDVFHFARLLREYGT